MFERGRRPVLAVLVFTVAGFSAIVLAWNGAASLDRVPGQLPFVISGGLGGLGLILVAAALAIVHEVRRSASQVLGALEQLGEVGAAGRQPGGPTVVPDGGPTVVAGRTTYHLETCRLVADRADLQAMSPATATERGLAPCRVCGAVAVAAR